MVKKLGEGFLILVLAAAPAFAEVKFKDVPADHWAAKSVYDLVKMGITQGYPDQTFRGNKNITRYETAIFLSKLAEKLGGPEMLNIKSDLKELKNEAARMRGLGNVSIAGSFEMAAKAANVFATAGSIVGKGPFFHYRIVSSINQEYGQGSSIKVNFDTMDAAYSGGITRDAVSQMMDVQGKLKINPVDIGVADLGFSQPIDLVLTVGPGPVQHTDTSGILPSENGYTYERPYSGLEVRTKLFALDLSQAYYQISKTNSGQSTVSLLKTLLSYNFMNVPFFKALNIEAVGNYYFRHPTNLGENDLRAALILSSDPTPRLKLKTTAGFGGKTRNAWIFKAEAALLDLLTPGTSIKIYASKIGSEFIASNFAQEQFNLAGYDLFMRPLIISTGNIGCDLVQSLSEKFAFRGLFDIRLSSDLGYGLLKPNSRATGQAGFVYDVNPSASLNVFYRVEQNPAINETTDFAAFGLIYRF